MQSPGEKATSVPPVASSWWGAIVVGVIATILIFGVKLWFEHTSIGRKIELETFSWLQEKLSPFSPSGLQVVVINIESFGGGTEENPIPRGPLFALLSTIVSYGPAAVGVDIDLSPNEKGWLTQDDPEFFDGVLKLREKYNVPIFLGVHRSVVGHAGRYLGRSEYELMAVRGTSPTEGETKASVYTNLWYQGNDIPYAIPNLSIALALEYLKHHPEPKPPAGFSHLVEGISIKEEMQEPEVDEGEYGHWRGRIPINFSKLDQIVFATKDVEPSCFGELARAVSGKMVVIGNAGDTSDFFSTPSGAQENGVFYHAVAAYTAAVEPVYELKSMVRITIDILISGAAILALSFLRRDFQKRKSLPMEAQ